MQGVPKPPQNSPDTEGNELVPGKKYIIKAKAHLAEYGHVPDQTLVFEKYDLGDGLYFPMFVDPRGGFTGLNPSSYTYTPVPQTGGSRHKKNTRRNKNKKQSRRRKIRR